MTDHTHKMVQMLPDMITQCWTPPVEEGEVEGEPPVAALRLRGLTLDASALGDELV